MKQEDGTEQNQQKKEPFFLMNRKIVLKCHRLLLPTFRDSEQKRKQEERQSIPKAVKCLPYATVKE